MAEAQGGGPHREGVAPPRWASLVAVLLLGTMAVALVAPVRFALWPVTSWELFSRPRSAEQATYQVDLVAPDGDVAPLPFSRLGSGHRRWLTIARTFPTATPEERTRVCRAWADAAVVALGAERVAEVRVRRVVIRAAPEASQSPRPVSERLSVRCTPS